MISSYIYKKMISGNFFTKRVYGLIRQLLIKLNEHQLCCMKIHGQDLVMPLSHSLPLYLHEFPLYDSLPHRLTGFIKLKSQYIKAIDVGANIGDSIAAFMSPAGPSTEPENLDLFIAV